jgi:membrane-bound ClpP family serine protease
MFAGSFWVGMKWYELLTSKKDDSDRAADWIAFIASVLVGIGILALLMSLMTHGMVRAFGEELASSDDDD